MKTEEWKQKKWRNLNSGCRCRLIPHRDRAVKHAHTHTRKCKCVDLHTTRHPTAAAAGTVKRRIRPRGSIFKNNFFKKMLYFVLQDRGIAEQKWNEGWRWKRRWRRRRKKIDKKDKNEYKGSEIHWMSSRDYVRRLRVCVCLVSPFGFEKREEILFAVWTIWKAMFMCTYKKALSLHRAPHPSVYWLLKLGVCLKVIEFLMFPFPSTHSSATEEEFGNTPAK